jgi:hypothetical protein
MPRAPTQMSSGVRWEDLDKSHPTHVERHPTIA